MKTCSKGHTWDGVKRKCPTCQKAYLSNYYQTHKEKHRKLAKIWKEKNKEKHIAYHKEYRANRDKTKHNEQNREWYKNHLSRPVWRGMIDRCTKPKHHAWKDYGGRGIKVFEEWQGKDGFRNFDAYMGPRPSRKYSLDRYPNNNGNYEPGNVRWATMGQQALNRRKVGALESFTTEELIAELRKRNIGIGDFHLAS